MGWDSGVGLISLGTWYLSGSAQILGADLGIHRPLCCSRMSSEGLSLAGYRANSTQHRFLAG